MKATRLSKITLEGAKARELARRKNVVRRVSDPKPTGHIAYGWMGTAHQQWAGWVKVGGTLMSVWGYTEVFGKVPTEWSDDTY